MKVELEGNNSMKVCELEFFFLLVVAYPTAVGTLSTGSIKLYNKWLHK